MYKSWPWQIANGNCILVTVWYIMGIPQIISGVVGSTFPKLDCRAWLCFAVVLIFLHILWYPQFGSSTRLSIFPIQLTALWVLMRLKPLWGILSLLPEQWYLQCPGIIVRCTASDSHWTSCADTWIIFDIHWSLRPLQNRQLLPWSFWSMMCMLGFWTVRLVCHVLGDHIIQ